MAQSLLRCEITHWENIEFIFYILILFNVMHDVPNIDPYSAGIDFRRQVLTSVDWRLKSIPAL